MRGHKQSVRRFESNRAHNLMLSMSSDVINLWSLTNFEKHRSVFAHNQSFQDALFTPTGSHLCTLFRDSSFYLWSLKSFEPEFKVDDTPAGFNLRSIDLAPDMSKAVAGGSSPFVVVWTMTEFLEGGHLKRDVYRLPDGFASVQKVRFLSGSD